MRTKNLTPAMRQYLEIKDAHRDCIIFFRMGDFYEMFFEDAQVASKVLQITLTSRNKGKEDAIPLCGVPHHAASSYISKLVEHGYKVAICEQMEDPREAKGIVKREVVRIVTPGLVVDPDNLNAKENNFLAAVHIDKKIAGVAFLDISTGEFLVSEGTIEYIDQMLNNFQPKEVLFENKNKTLFLEYFGPKFYTFKLDDWIFTHEAANDRLTKQFETSSLKGFGVQNLSFGIIAAGAILYYLDITQHEQLGHITSLSRIEQSRYVWLDKFTIKNLEIFRSPYEGASTLIDVMDRTISPMGGRLLKRWLSLPLKGIQAVNERLDIVQYFVENPAVKDEIKEQTKGRDAENEEQWFDIGQIEM